MNLSIVSLQIALPGAVELAIILAILAVLAVLPAVWVYYDARKRGLNAALWAVAVGGAFLLAFLPGLVVLLVYLWRRADARTETVAA